MRIRHLTVLILVLALFLAWGAHNQALSRQVYRSRLALVDDRLRKCAEDEAHLLKMSAELTACVEGGHRVTHSYALKFGQPFCRHCVVSWGNRRTGMLETPQERLSRIPVSLKTVRAKHQALLAERTKVIAGAPRWYDVSSPW
jgi:hypothetical protein